MDIDRELRLATTTGKVIFGADKTIKSVKIGKAKIAVISSSCSEEVKEDIQHYASLSEIPVHAYDGDSSDLGIACGKPFLVSAMAVIELGNSSLLELGGS